MRWLQPILAGIFSLFVDDSSFALTIIVWLGVIWLALPRLNLPSALSGVILFAGLATILAASALLRARRKFQEIDVECVQTPSDLIP